MNRAENIVLVSEAFHGFHISTSSTSRFLIMPVANGRSLKICMITKSHKLPKEGEENYPNELKVFDVTSR
jgi:hypothetical protein